MFEVEYRGKTLEIRTRDELEGTSRVFHASQKTPYYNNGGEYIPRLYIPIREWRIFASNTHIAKRIALKLDEMSEEGTGSPS